MRRESIYRNEAGERAVMSRYDAIFARWPVANEVRRVETRHGATSVIASGPAAGPAAVLLHGASSNALMWMGDVEPLARDHRVFAVDIIGEPGRSAPTRPPWTGSAYADWLADVLDGLGLRSASIVALSQGGWIALSFATRHPERVERLALLSPAGVVRDRVTFLLRAVPLLMLGRRGRRAVNQLVIGPRPMAEEAFDFMDAITANVRMRLDAAPLFSDEELRRLTMPVLVMGGDRDVIRDCAAIGERLRALLPRCEARVMPGAGHAVVGVGEEVARFLEARA